MRIALIGAGAIGGMLAVRLALSGQAAAGSGSEGRPTPCLSSFAPAISVERLGAAHSLVGTDRLLRQTTRLSP